MSDKIPVLKIIGAFGVIFALVAGIWGAINWIDKRIESAVNDENFIRRVSSYVRPYVIFDVNESILVDGGAMQVLEPIKVEIGKDQGTVSVTITVTPKHHLAYPPLIENLGVGRFVRNPNPKRGPGYQWIYEVEIAFWKTTDETPASFRLEIIR